MMRIAYITSHINNSLQWVWFSEELSKRNIYHIHIIITPNRALLFGDMESMGIPVYHLVHKNFLSHFKNFFKCRKLLKQHSIDTSHTELPYGNLVGLSSAWSLGLKKRVSTCENTTWAQDYNSLKQKLIDKFTYKVATDVIALTDISKDYLIRQYGVGFNKIVTIPHALKVLEYEQIEEYRVAKIREQIGIDNNDFAIGMVARFEEWKGHLYAIKAMTHLVTKYPHAKLLIVGAAQGSFYEQCKQLIRDLNLSTNVIICDFISDNKALYKVFDIHLHIPVSELVETFGINIIEGMISGRAQVLTRSGVAFYTAKHLENAYVVKYKDDVDTAYGIEKLIESAELRQNLGSNAKQYALKYFNYSSKVDRHLEVYEKN